MPPKKDPKKPFRKGGKRRTNRREKADSVPAKMIPFPDTMVLYCRNRKQILDIRPETFDYAQLLKAYAEKTETTDVEFDVVFGTERSVKQYFKISDAKYDQERVEREKLQAQADKL